MIEQTIKLNLLHGFHMRPAGVFVREAAKFKSKITIFYGDQMADGKSIMGLLTLGLTNNSLMKIVIDGPDEKKAMEHLKKVIKEKLQDL